MRNEMSVGTSSDIRKASILCRDVYRKCREAGAEYEEIRREVKGLYGVLRELKEEEEERNGEWDEGNWGRVEGIIGDCEGTLRQLDGLLGRYGRNGGGRLGSNEMDQLGGIRVRLISHKKNVSHFLDSLLHEDEDGDTNGTEGLDGKGELDMLLDKVDDIAADRSRRLGTSQMMGSENEDEEDNLQIWKWFRRNLIEEGVNRVVLERHKDVLIAYIRQMEQDGLLNENPSASTPQTSPRTHYKEQWDSTYSDSSHTQAAPASFDNTDINIGRNDPGAKEMIQREDNIKFPPAMKFQRPKPESLVDSYPYPGQNISSAPHRQLSPPLTPKISTTDLDISKSQCAKDISGSKLNSEDNTSSTHQTISRYPVNPNNDNTSIIQTSDLLLLPCFATSNPQLLPPSSPGSWNSNLNSYSYPDEPPNKNIQSPQLKTMTLRPKHSSDPVQKSSPRTSGVRFDLPDANQSSKTHTPSSGNNPHDSTIPIPIPTSILKSKIAPDSSGHEIPQDAKWTKVKRSLISPEVLMKDGRRFEARPEFVAILGILTKEEIQQYAERSHVLREERWWRNHPEQRERRERGERSERSRRRNSGDEESSSCSSNSSSEMSSDSDSDINEHRRRGEKRNGDARGKGRRGDEWEERGERGERKGRSERYNRRERDREANYTFAPQSQPQPQPQHFSASPYSASNNSLPGRGMDIPGMNQTPNGYAPLGSFPGQQNYPQQGYPPPPQQQPPYPIQNQFPQPPYPQGQGPPPINQNQYLSPNPYAPYSTSPSGASPTYAPNPSYSPHNSRRHHSHSHSHSQSRSPHSHSHSHHSRSRRSRDSDPRSSEPRRQNSGTTSTHTSSSTSKWRDHLAAAGIGGGLGGAAVGLWEVLSEAAEGF
ncbi:uncharacterized protein Bfra_006293 [Botrytis fragariae]|uniref:DUF8035 domain-containing protein n=1 Tax=Botrytis fragariae TaxID=1964551 RepID=A0A8H6ENY2_9HELO|nr:uncharacterized protein Bfra_006293 [Botrytis fragariae]KAF5879089.1 hypothetical protein Bfra_006293 [Botrytis fragariae]